MSHSAECKCVVHAKPEDMLHTASKQTNKSVQHALWYEAKTGNHQGLVIEEGTGRNIAVAYDKADAPLIAAAPELLEAAKYMLKHGADDPDSVLQLQAAIAKAERELNGVNGE